MGTYYVDNDKDKSDKDKTGAIMTCTGKTRVKGGIMTKRDRICAFARLADKSNQHFNAAKPNGPGQYDPKRPEAHQAAPVFGASDRNKSESKSKVQPSAVGPGHYNPNYKHVDHTVPGYYHAKHTDTDSYMARLNRDRNATPFPCYKDMQQNLWSMWPESDKFDKRGLKKHCKNLLKDRTVTPGRKVSAANARSRRYSATPEPFSLRDLSQLASETPRPASEIPRYSPRPASETPRPGSETPRPPSVTPRPPSDTPRPYTPRPASVGTPRPASAL